MIKALIKIVSYITIFLLLVSFFLPKDQIYFKIEEIFQKKQIIISEENVSENIFSLELTQMKLFYNTLEVVDIKKSHFQLFFFANSLKIEEIKVLDSFQNHLPKNIKVLKLNYTLFNPLNIIIESQGEFGEIDGKFSFLDKKLYLNLTPSKKMLNQYQDILKEMTEKQGVYTYEYQL